MSYLLRVFRIDVKVHEGRPTRRIRTVSLVRRHFEIFRPLDTSALLYSDQFNLLLGVYNEAIARNSETRYLSFVKVKEVVWEWVEDLASIYGRSPNSHSNIGVRYA